MKNRNKKTILIVFSLILLFIIGFFGTLYYLTSTVNNYSFAEKKWISENSSKTFEIYVEPNLPVFSKDGKGVFHEYLKALKEDTGLSFDINTTNNEGIKLINKNSISDNDILFYKDHYVLLGSKDIISTLNDLSNKKIGVIEVDKSVVSYYLTEYNNINLKSYKNINALNEAYSTKEIDFIIVPMYRYLDVIIASNIEIVFHLDGLFSYYTLVPSKDTEILNSIMSKFYNRWEKVSIEKNNSYFLEMYYNAKEYSEIEKESITDEDFIVGYINNLPFEGMIRKNFTGLTDTYLSKFANITGVTYKYIKYNDLKEMKAALQDNKIDIMFNYYSLNNSNFTSTRTLGSTEYVVLAHSDNNIVVNSLYSLKNTTVTMLNNMNLKYNMSSRNLFEIKDFDDVKSLLKNINKDSIVIVEKEVYDYYKDSSLKKYSIRYIDTVKLNNSFLLNNKNSAFNKLFDFYLSTLSPNEIKNESVTGVLDTLRSNRIFNFLKNNLLYLIFILLILSFMTYIVIRRTLYSKKIKKEDRLYYFDAMTNLKNRNYLNDNIDFWSSTKVYPQAIIVIDINGLRKLNDTLGHEAGDNQIKAVSSVLIKTQRDNTEIMRTDGDEFMIYLVGYDEKKIGTYIHKLNKELYASLPNKEYGVSIGYAMITNEQTTIDDAINDSLSMIRSSKARNNER